MRIDESRAHDLSHVPHASRFVKVFGLDSQYFAPIIGYDDVISERMTIHRIDRIGGIFIHDSKKVNCKEIALKSLVLACRTMNKEEEILTNTDTPIIKDEAPLFEVDQYVQTVMTSGQALISRVLDEGDRLHDQVVDLEKISKGNEIGQEVRRSFLLGQQTKILALLHRDIMFELQKASVLSMENEVSTEQLDRLIQESTETLDAATTDYENVLSANKYHLKDAQAMVKQDHPWPIYREQLQTVHDQMNELIDNRSTLESISISVEGVKKAIKEGLEQMSTRLVHVANQAQKIEEQDDKASIDDFIDLLNNINLDLEQSGAIANVHLAIAGAIEEAPLTCIPKVGVAHGMLVEEELSCKYKLEQWYEIEVLPLLEDGFQQADTMTYNFRLAIINITNRLELLLNKNNGFTIEEHLQPLHRFIESIPEFKSTIESRITEIEKKIESNLSLVPLFNDEEVFLALGIQGSINRFKKEQNLIFGKINYYWSSLKDKYFSIKSTVQEESKLGDVEKVIRYIQSAGVDSRNTHYNNFFNAKVTLVEAFWIERKLEQKRVLQVIQSWNAGYHGAVAFYGDRYTGKSSFGDWLSQTHFRGKTYSLVPNKTVMIYNKKVQLTDDLLESINLFIERVQYARPLIWIDDIEQWFDDLHRPDEVMIGLADLINAYSKKVFFAVSMGSWTYKRLNRFLDLEHTFQSTIDLAPFTNDMLKEAILLRHGASHKSLVTTDSHELSKMEFDRHVRNINRLAEGNVGHALQLWVNSIAYKDDQYVELGEELKYSLPDIITSDNGIVLVSLLVHRKMTESALAELLGPAYHDRYKLEVARLVGSGVVRRSFNDTLSINDKVVPPITKALRKNRFI